MKQLSIDLNADLGEGFPFDAELMNVVSSANICSGAYIANTQPVRQALALAVRAEVRVGIHVGYPDVEGFGRRAEYQTPKEFSKALHEQVDRFLVLAKAVNADVLYLKPHGALYHDLSSKSDLWEILIKCCEQHQWSIMHLAASDFLAEASKSIDAIHEGFVDRRYASTQELVSRSNPQGVLTDVEEVLAQAQELANGKVSLADGAGAELNVQSLCLHGDTPNALQLGTAVRKYLIKNNILISSAV